jgi:geranylgeranyl diphosphate synthase, type I
MERFRLNDGGTSVTAVMPEGVALARDLVGPAMESAISRLTPDVRVVAAYHLGLADAEGNPTGGGSGKALRPALALLSARAAGAPQERGVTSAVAVELVHNFSLLHDDIMDGDTERRHRPTAWTVFGVGAAILAGDALLALAQDMLLEDGTPQGAWAARCLSAAVQRLIGGQGSDLAFEKRDDVSLAECLEMAGDKTAALMACACSIGAVHLGAPPTLAMGLAGFGAHVGLAFQLTDDLLGIWGAPAVTGKPVRADLRARKKSLPVVAALTSGTPQAAELRALLTDPRPLTEDDLIRAADLVVEAGGKAWAENEADVQLAAANQSLADIDLPADVHAELTAIAEFITARQW